MNLHTDGTGGACVTLKSLASDKCLRYNAAVFAISREMVSKVTMFQQSRNYHLANTTPTQLQLFSGALQIQSCNYQAVTLMCASHVIKTVRDAMSEGLRDKKLLQFCLFSVVAFCKHKEYLYSTVCIVYTSKYRT